MAASAPAHPSHWNTEPRMMVVIAVSPVSIAGGPAASPPQGVGASRRLLGSLAALTRALAAFAARGQNAEPGAFLARPHGRALTSGQRPRDGNEAAGCYLVRGSLRSTKRVNAL